MPVVKHSPARKSPAPVRIRTLLYAGGILAAACVLSIFLAAFTRIGLEGGTYVLNNTPASFEFPLKLKGFPTADIPVTFSLKTGLLRPSQYYILVDDCLQSLSINGQAVESSVIPYCDYVNGRTFDLGPYLKTGENQVHMVIHNSIADFGVQLRPSLADVVFLLPFFVLLAGITGAFFFAFTALRLPVWTSHTFGVLLAGTIFRIYYVFITPYWVRGHDTDSHLEYISYIATHLSLPRPDLGWETWQPPLYYILGALWTLFGDFLGLSEGSIVNGIQIFALILSIASLPLILWIGLRILPVSHRPLLPLFLAVPAFLPSFVFFSGRINNDVLVTFLEILAIALFLEWRRKKSLPLWMVTWVTVGLAVLTKNTALLLLPAFLAALFLEKPWKERTVWMKKMKLASAALLIVVLIAGWFTVYRKIEAGSQNLIIGNHGNLHGGLVLQNTVPHFLTFSPVGMIRHAYNNPWEDSARRQNFWEYLYRSAFFGEFNFGNDRLYMASSILFFSFFSFLTALFGLFRSFRTADASRIPMLMLGGALLLGHMIFRLKFPYSSSQDFRYSLLFIIPFSYWLVLGIAAMRPALLQQCMLLATEICLALSILLLL